MKVDFTDEYKKHITATGLTQWDYGQKLEIYGIPDVTHAEVHFCCESDTEALIQQAVVPLLLHLSTGSCPVHSVPLLRWVRDRA